jgi:serine/threonine protein kinase
VDSLGKGGFGAVFRAIDLQNGGTVAIKVISLKNVPKDEIASIQVCSFFIPPRQPRDSCAHV